MKNFNPLFTIGITGIVATAVFHIVAPLILAGNGVNAAFLILYPLSVLFLAFGFRKILKEQKLDKNKLAGFGNI